MALFAGIFTGHLISRVRQSLLVLHIKISSLKGLFHPACLARVVSWFAFVAPILMAHENGNEQRQAKRRQMQGMLDETDPLSAIFAVQICCGIFFIS